MRRIIYYLACSVDNYIARPDGSVDWLPTEGEFGYEEFLATVDSVLMGGNTFRKNLEFGIKAYEGKNNYIVTSARYDMDIENLNFIHGENPVSQIRAIKESAGGDIWLVGGTQLFDSLLMAKLVDEIRIFTIPVLIGEGIPLFSSKQEIRLELIATNRYQDGIIELHYRFLYK